MLTVNKPVPVRKPKQSVSSRSRAKNTKRPKGSKSQTKLAAYCKRVLANNPPYQQEKTFPWLLSPKGYPMYVDIMFSSLNLAIELNGPQHYTRTKYTPTSTKLKELQARDKLKAQLLRDNGYTIIAWPYTRCISLKAVHQELSKHGFKVQIPPRKKPGRKPKAKTKRKRIKKLKRLRKI